MMAVSRSEYRRRRLIARCAEDDRFPLLITKPGDAIQLQAPEAEVKRKSVRSPAFSGTNAIEPLICADIH